MNAALYQKLLRLYALEKYLLSLNPKDPKINALKVEMNCSTLMDEIEAYGEVISEMHKVRKEYTINA
jgi:hypothetical protein